jgi:phosphoglycerol transferase MdoB-like AlkP superfamily enzyme
MPVLPGNFGNLPRLGFGLWSHPPAAAFVELVLVLAGSIMYWRAALDVSARAGRSGKLGSISAALIAAFGLFVLFLDYTS